MDAVREEPDVKAGENREKSEKWQSTNNPVAKAK